MIGFDAIKDQDQPIRILTAFFNAGKIPHAMLFTGSDGVGKKTTALAFAMLCNCTCTGEGVAAAASSVMPRGAGPCGKCRACKKIVADSHPDIIRMAPAGQFIRIAQVRELLQVLAMKPYEASLRVVIISDVHTMNPEAGNALLKVLEEPPDRTILILTARGTADLLPTIVSRCRRIRFNPLTRQSLVDMLMKNLSLPRETASVLASMANGGYGRALSLHRNNRLHHRHWLLEAGGFLEGSPSAKRPIPVLMAVAARLAENKHQLMETMDILTSIYRDLAVSRFHRGHLMNEDMAGRIQSAAEQMRDTDILDKIKEIETAEKLIAANANTRLTVERLLLRLSNHLPTPFESALIR